MVIATLLLFALLFITWAEIAVSSWIVGRSGVEDLMQRDGKQTLLFFKDTFFHLGSGILLAELALGGTLLCLLWHRLFRV